MLKDIVLFFLQMLDVFIRGNKTSLAKYLRKRVYSTQCEIEPNVFISNPRNFSAQPGSALYDSCHILNHKGKFTIGKNSHLGASCYVNVCYGEVTIGDDVAIGPGTKIIVYSNHYEKSKKVTETKITDNIVIKNNVLIGANCTVLPGTTIPNNVVIGAGSVIKGTLESNAVYVGVPCKKIHDYWYE